MSLVLTVLGSSGIFATPDRAASGYLLEIDGTRIWMDAGSGTWQNLLLHTHYRDLGGIILTHRHPDHITDVFQCFHARRWGEAEPLPLIPLWTTVGTRDVLLAVAPVDESFDVHIVKSGSEIEVAGATITFREMAHPPETLGVRVEKDGGVLAYSSDTGAEGAFADLAAGADVFVCEATHQHDGEWEGHLSAADAGRIATELGCRRLVLTHLPPGRDHLRSLAQAQAAAKGVDVILAQDGLRLEVRA